MKLLNWLKDRTPTEADIVEFVAADIPDDFVLVEPVNDEQHETIEISSEGKESEVEPKTRFELEPIFVLIDYRNAAGQFSRRRITLRYFEKHGPVCYVRAVCHERRAARTFRLDRFEGVIDQDGVVSDAASFFYNLIEGEIGQVIEAAANTPGVVRRDNSASAYTLLRRELKPALILLSAAARVDNFLHPEEVDRIMLFTETEAQFLANDGIVTELPGLDGFDRLGRLVQRLRPTQTEFNEALEVVCEWPEERLQRLFEGIVGVIQADNVVVDSEFNFVSDVHEWVRMQNNTTY